MWQWIGKGHNKTKNFWLQRSDWLLELLEPIRKKLWKLETIRRKYIDSCLIWGIGAPEEHWVIVQQPAGQTAKLPLPADVGPGPEDRKHVLLGNHLDESGKWNIIKLISQPKSHDVCFSGILLHGGHEADITQYGRCKSSEWVSMLLWILNFLSVSDYDRRLL